MSLPIPPGSTIGILGGGQLGRMLSMAAARLGFDVAVLTPEENAPAARVSARAFVADYEDPAALDALADISAVITFEFENVPAGAVEYLGRRGAVIAPGARALAVAQDRLAEKAFLNQAGLATVAFARVDEAADITAAFERLGPRLLLKTRHGGYDGKGQLWVRPGEEASAFAALGGRPAIVEAPALFRRECAVIGARGWNGELALFPMTESRHEDGILRRTLAPAAASAQTRGAAQAIARRLLTALDYVGVLGVELFEDGDGALLVNEFAPRVHNTGHWTLDGCRTDQFEQHVRAIAGWPLGPTDAIAKVEMINLLGDEATGWAAFAADPACRVWLYGKPEARPGRKMGHINRILDDDASA